MLRKVVETDHLVVGAGAMGMAFVDALVTHADVHVTVVDRRDGTGGHWRDAYPFVQLHQASLFYGVASTELGDGELQTEGPEAGLHERAGLTEILTYYDRVQQRLEATGQVTFLTGHEHAERDGRHVARSVRSGEEVALRVRRRVVDAAYLEPTVPATTPPPFEVADDARVVPVGALPDAASSAREFVVVGSGKTATDAIVWLLRAGVDPDRVLWVRPRDPWMLDRARVQPDPTVITELAADTFEAASDATTLEELFRRLEASGVLLRIDEDHWPTMARTPTLGAWELELLRTVERVVRMGHVRAVRAGELQLTDGVVPIARDALVVHCAASGLGAAPLVPIWQPDRIRLQTVRAGFPCFCAALLGYVEATRDDDRERNRVCRPNLYGDGFASWAEMQARGARNAAVYGAEPDVAAWADTVALNPGRVLPAQRDSPELAAARDRLAGLAAVGTTALAALAGGMDRAVRT